MSEASIAAQMRGKDVGERMCWIHGYVTAVRDAAELVARGSQETGEALSRLATEAGELATRLAAEER